MGALPSGVKKGFKYDFSDVYNQVVKPETNRGPEYALVPASGCAPGQEGSMGLEVSVTRPVLMEMGKRNLLVGAAYAEFAKLAGFRGQKA